MDSDPWNGLQRPRSDLVEPFSPEWCLNWILSWGGRTLFPFLGLFLSLVSKEPVPFLGWENLLFFYWYCFWALSLFPLALYTVSWSSGRTRSPVCEPGSLVTTMALLCSRTCSMAVNTPGIEDMARYSLPRVVPCRLAMRHVTHTLARTTTALIVHSRDS